MVAVRWQQSNTDGDALEKIWRTCSHGLGEVGHVYDAAAFTQFPH